MFDVSKIAQKPWNTLWRGDLRSRYINSVNMFKDNRSASQSTSLTLKDENWDPEESRRIAELKSLNLEYPRANCRSLS